MNLSNPEGFRVRLPMAKILGMFLLLLGCKFSVMHLCSTALPFFDQWEGEGSKLLLPWLRGELHLADLFAPHCQHRIVWTRLLVLGLFQINGQWDAQVEMIVAAIIHALVAVVLGVILIRRLGRAWEDAILICLLLLYALPFAYENTLSGGFASQYYILFLFSVLGIWGLASHRPGSVCWWVGVASAFMAWFTVATGGLAGLAAASWIGLRLTRREGSSRENWLAFIVAVALGLGGCCMSIGVAQVGDLQPHSAGEFLTKFAGLMGWPNPTAWAAPIAYAPFFWFAWQTIRRRQATGSAEAFLIPLGVFALLQTAAVAYARNHYRDLQVSRYMDFLNFGTLVNFACLLMFLRQAGAGGSSPRARARLGLLAVVWVVVAGFGLTRLTTQNVTFDLPFMRTCSESENTNIAAFVARPTPNFFDGKEWYDLMCEKKSLLVDVLQDPLMRQILPVQARSSLVLKSVRISPLVHEVVESLENPVKLGWALSPGPAGQSVYFRSQTLSGLRLPYLEFPKVGEIGSDACIALFDERSGETTWLARNISRSKWQSALVKMPSGPFHVEAAIAGGSMRGLAFYHPKEVGWLSAWVDTFLDSDVALLFAGLGTWLAASFWRRLGLRSLSVGRQAQPASETPGQFAERKDESGHPAPSAISAIPCR